MTCVKDFLKLHNAEHYDWHTRLTGTSEVEFGEHLVQVAPLTDGEVFFVWQGPKLTQRRYRKLKAGEHLEGIENLLRRLAV